MPVVIENNSSDPVDYDVSIEGGGNMIDPALAGSISAGLPRFLLRPGSSMTYDFSEAGVARHRFLIQSGSAETTHIELRNVPTTVAIVALDSAESGGETFYRIETK